MITKKVTSPAGVNWTKTGLVIAFEKSCVTSTGRIIATKPSSESYSAGYSDDNGITWTWGSSIDNRGRTPTTALCVTSTGRILAGLSKSLYGSDDNGITWRLLASMNVAIKVLCVTSTGRILAGKKGAVISYSDDNGATWADTQSQSLNWSALCVTSTGRILAACAAKRIYYSDDNGITWTETQSPSITWSALCVVSTGRIVAASSGSGSGSFYYSDNDGITWTKASDYVKKDWKKVCTTPTGGLIAITGISSDICYSTDNGVTWTIVTKIGDSNVTDIIWQDICVVSTGRVFISGQYGAYIYSDPCVKLESTNEPITGKQAKELVQQCKAYVQSKKQS